MSNKSAVSEGAVAEDEDYIAITVGPKSASRDVAKTLST